MEDFYYAGGVPAVVSELGDLLHRDAMYGQRQDHGREHRGRRCWNREVIFTARQAVQAAGRHRRAARQSGAQRRGDQAVGGDAGAAEASRPRRGVREHRGFQGAASTIRRSTSTRPACMVLKNCGPKGYPGMAEVGNMPLPPKLLQKGVRDMVRISDARMSGTAYGTVVLHTSPESAAGGPLALVRNGDMIELDVAGRRLQLDVAEAELERRRAAWTPPPPAHDRRLSEALHRSRAAGRPGRRSRFSGRLARSGHPARSRTDGRRCRFGPPRQMKSRCRR